MDKQRMYNEFLELVQTDSASGKEDAIAVKLTKKLEELGFTVTMDDAGPKFGGVCGNLIAIREGELPGALMLSSHMDRVPNGFGIKPVEKDGVLYSDGTTILAADDISGVCAILEGLRQTIGDRKPLPRLEVVFTIQEELCLGGAKVMDPSVLKAHIGYIFDSPGGAGRFINGAPGRYILKAEITGKPAHAGNAPEKGIDAAKTMADIISTLKQGRLDEISTSNFPHLESGVGSANINVVSDHALIEGEARSRDLKRLLDYVEYFRDHCQKVAAEHGAKVEVTTEENFLPFLITEEDESLVIAKAACEKLGLPFETAVLGGAFDGNIHNARGMACIGVATGYAKNHTTEEQLTLEDFYQSGQLCAELIETFAESLQK